MMKNALKPGKRLLAAIITDLLVFGVFLNVFAYFHHVRVRNAGSFEIPSSAGNGSPAATFAFPSDTPAPEETPAPEADQTADLSDAPATDSPFSDGDAVSYENTYQSENVSVKVTKRTVGESVCFIADIYVKDISSIKTAIAIDYKDYNDGSRKNVMQVTKMAELTDSIVALSGDNYVFRQAGLLVIRNGQGIDVQFPIEDDLCVLYKDGVMETYGKWTVNRESIQTIYDREPYQAWSFGPMLLTDGQPMDRFNSSVGKVNPRSAIGYYEPGHYCFVLVDGRQAGYSAGMTLTELSQLFYDLGCKAAYNLDGGDTVAMAFKTDLINHPENESPRSVSDMIYICEPDPADAQPAASPAQPAEGEE